jgi:D-alanyl-D-alanine carboxypeptidase/D-alanyl-D-alanine-endopeptidase (penicillin-binding protein 4)
MLHRGSKAVIGVLTSALILAVAIPAQALTLPSLFVKLANSATLARPGIIVIDPATSETIYSQGADIGRAPASVLKLFSMATTLSVLNPDQTFETSLHETAKADTFILQGSSDPWLTESPFEAHKYHRAFFPALINRLLLLHPSLRAITLEYNNVYALDIHALQRYFSGRLRISPVKVNSGVDATTQLAVIASPPLAKIIEFTLLYSDNVLADRLARISTRALGFPPTVPGLQAAFEKTLNDLGISPVGLHIYDGNGLSHNTRVTTRQVADLLVAIVKSPKFKVILAGLPTAGKTGTLKDRFVKDAPAAVGLVRAKSGWINTTVSLAGFVTVGANNYVFAILANHIRNLESARQAARTTIDQMLGSIARPQK